MKTTTNPAPCTCGSDVCAMRLGRGLRAFCDTTLRTETTAADRLPSWGSYSAAVEANPGRRVRCVGGGLTGAPRRFVVG